MLSSLLMPAGITFLVVSLSATAGDVASFKPATGFVPTADVAIAIAVAVLGPIYGKDDIEHETPFHARLIAGVWIVSGSLRPGQVGGVAEARIAQVDGRVLGVLHGK
jgi:hypothetical protein